MDSAPWWVVVVVSLVTLLIGQAGSYLVAAKQADRDAKAREMDAQNLLDRLTLEQAGTQTREREQREAAFAAARQEKRERATESALEALAVLRADIAASSAPHNDTSGPASRPNPEALKSFITAMGHYQFIVDRERRVRPLSGHVVELTEKYVEEWTLGPEWFSTTELTNSLSALEDLVLAEEI